MSSTKTTALAPVLKVPKDAKRLADNRDWTNRFDVRSESSDRLYTIAQHKDKRHWGCSCPGWRRYRRCKHLEALSLPAGERPHEVRLA